jgi:hypothetical protein
MQLGNASEILLWQRTINEEPLKLQGEDMMATFGGVWSIQPAKEYEASGTRRPVCEQNGI